MFSFNNQLNHKSLGEMLKSPKFFQREKTFSKFSVIKMILIKNIKIL